MNLKDIYKENFSIDEIVSLINAYAKIINDLGNGVDFVCTLDNLMDALEEKVIEEN